MRRGSVELSLNALIMFILSVMVLGAGIYLVSVFLELGRIEPPDRCDRELTTNNEQFAICPQTIPDTGTFSSRDSYEVRYEFYNLADDVHTNYAIGIAPDDKFIVDAVPLRDVNRGDEKRGVFLIRRDPNSAASLGSTESIRVFICPEDIADAGEPDCTGHYLKDMQPRFSRVLTIDTG